MLLVKHDMLEASPKNEENEQNICTPLRYVKKKFAFGHCLVIFGSVAMRTPVDRSRALWQALAMGEEVLVRAADTSNFHWQAKAFKMKTGKMPQLLFLHVGFLEYKNVFDGFKT